MQVGSVNNTFGIQGVRQHCQFFKTIEDAVRLRKRISECFERAALPNVSVLFYLHINSRACNTVGMLYQLLCCRRFKHELA
jgi:NADH dehydrogenase FAD-containing subunit